MKKNYLLGFCLLANLSLAFTQPIFWESQKVEDLPALGERRIIPNNPAIYALDTLGLQAFLAAVPHESEVALDQSPSVLHLPRPDGGFEAFRLVRYDMMEPELADSWTFVQTFRGVSKSNPLSFIRVDWTLRGFHAMVYEPGNTWYIDPYFWEDQTFYQSYTKSDYPLPDEPFHCGVEDEFVDGMAEKPTEAGRAGDCQLRSYRFAVACTGEYTAYHGGTVGDAASAVVTTLNRVNGVFERDLAIRLVLIGNNNSIIYTNSGSDPYSNDDDNAAGLMINENQTNIDAVIGTANYDIGHVFGTNGGGLASLRGPCKVNRKARGVTGSGNPVGDPFDIDYVAHEIGHQYGANHTQNNNCNRSSASMEPGSASTIMGYAGICSPNIQSNSDDYFHGVSIQEVSNYMESGEGDNCATILTSANNNPAIAPGMDHTIPASTPFVLTAAAADGDGHPLTYCWEQYDPEVGAIMPPDETNVQGPLFRSFDPVSEPSRYFPALNALVNNVDPTWEELPAVSRGMTFRVTVRDFYTDGLNNHGCTIEDEVEVTADASAGPFLVNSPNTAVTWYEGETRTVTWAVAGTNNAPISCANVTITLSYDGGLTYPTTLLASTPNDGSQNIVVPAGTTNNARVRVQCVDNIFFDISNTDFTIAPAQAPDYTLEDLSGTQTICGGTNSAQYTIRTSSIFSYSDPITLSVTSAPAGVNASFSPNPVAPGNDAVLTLSNLGGLSPGGYTITVEAASTSGTKSVDLSLTVVQAASQASTISPVDGSSNIDLFPAFDWADAAGTDYYFLEISDDPGFGNIVVTESVAVSEYQLATALSGNTIYYWRVTSGSNNCGLAAPSAGKSFTTRNCFFYASSDVPKVISFSGTPTITSTVNVPLAGTIDDVDLIALDVQHTYLNDLIINLQKAGGSQAQVISRICGDANNLLVSLDDDASVSLTDFCPPTDGRYYLPEEDPLSTLNGATVGGDWTLTIDDAANQDGGSLDGWGVQVCYSALLPVEWLSFAAAAKDQLIELDWTTGEESGNAGFDVERRADFEPGFKAIGWVPATTDLQAVNGYTFTDTDVLPGVLYHYRLRQVDFDGQDDYSEIRSARIVGQEPVWRCYPNPTKGTIQMGIWGVEQDVQGVLLDAQGRIVQNVALTANQLTMQDLRHLPAGMYWLKLRADKWETTQRIVLLP